MESVEFMEFVTARMESCERVLKEKAEYYKSPTSPDRLIQFKQVAADNKQHPIRALKGMMDKHQSALLTEFEHIEMGNVRLTRVDEILTDLHNYLYLLEGLIIEAYRE